MLLCAFGVFVAVVALMYLGLYLMLHPRPYCISNADLSGKTAIVTGANSGIGYETAKDLCRRNARVIMICRDKKKGENAVFALIRETKHRNIVLKIADLSSMKSVRKVANEINEEENDLHILINNAGLMAQKKPLTEDGLDYTYATNHFGHFLLTNLLLGLLKKSAPSRIVNVSSVAQRRGKIQFDNLCGEKGFPLMPETWYCHTKLANCVFTVELARRLENTGVTANVLHPGIIRTNFEERLNPIAKIITSPFRFMFMTPQEGAQTTIHCAVCEKVEGVSGSYFVKCRASNAKANPCMFDADLGKKFWEASERLTGLVN